MALVKLSDYLVSRIPALTGSRHVFLLSGGGMMHLLDSAGSSKELIVIPMHHEQAASIAADAYGRTSNTIGVCFVTTGPGGTNAVTGVAGAFQESTPVLYISGQVSRANGVGNLHIRQKGVQEVAIVPIVSSITKYAAKVEDPMSIRFHLEKAIFLARSGRPGPVWLDIPLDVQNAIIDDNTLQGFDSEPLSTITNPPPTAAEIEYIQALIEKSQRPILVLGGGIITSGGRTLVKALVEKLNVPVQTSWNGMDLLPEDHPLFFGRANLFGPRYPNFIIQNCDLLLVIGSRLGLQHTGYNVLGFAREAAKIMVDIDLGEMEKPDLNVDVKINADAKLFIEQLLNCKLTPKLHSEWFTYCQQIRNRFPDVPLLENIQSEPYVNPYYFIDRLSSAIPRDCSIPFASSGMSHTITGSIFRVKEGQRVFTSKGLAAMGYAIPSAIGACFATHQRLTVTTVGDGGFQLNLQELQTIRHYHLPIKIFIFNNRGYHSIRMTQKTFFQERFVGSSEESGVSLPDLNEVAQLYRFGYYKLSCNDKVDSIVQQVLASSGPTLCEVMIDPNKPLEPKVVSYVKADGTMESRPIEDMAPLLDRQEFYKLMLIKPIT